MGVRQNKPVSRPDGGPWPSGRTTMRQNFLKFSRRNLSCIRTSSGRDGSIVRTDARPLQVISITGFARPDQGVGASGRLNFNTQFPYLMRVRPDGWSRIVSYHIRCTRVRTTAVRCLDGSFWIAILALRRYASGRYTTSSGRLIDLPFLGTWKESVNRSRIDRRPDVLQKRLDGASWHRSFSIRCRCLDGENTSSGQMMLVCLMSGRKDTSSGRME
jgi:hypothetical protein